MTERRKPEEKARCFNHAAASSLVGFGALRPHRCIFFASLALQHLYFSRCGMRERARAGAKNRERKKTPRAQRSVTTTRSLAAKCSDSFAPARSLAKYAGLLKMFRDYASAEL
jgi:hypothetical protein